LENRGDRGMITWSTWRAHRCRQRGELSLYRRGGGILDPGRASTAENSRVHGSEEALPSWRARASPADLHPGCSSGIGMGFTLAAVLRGLGAEGRVVVAELVPAL